jgi:hypothetical protein
MLKSLPVADPSSLYRVGDGNDCCLQGGPEDDGWGIFPYQLYQRFIAAAPEFEQLAAFQAGRSNFSVRRSETDQMAKPLRSEYVSGNYFATFGVPAFAGRTLVAAADQPSATPAAMLSYRAWQQEYGLDPRVVGSSFIVDGHPFTIVGITPPGFYGETLRSDPLQLFVPLQQESLLTGKNSILKQVNSWLRIIGMALGANKFSIIRLVLRGAFLQILIGLLIGVPASIGCARLVKAQLYEVKGWDPLVLGGSIAALAVCALVASIIPARRAASINPVTALRVE